MLTIEPGHPARDDAIVRTRIKRVEGLDRHDQPPIAARNSNQFAQVIRGVLPVAMEAHEKRPWRWGRGTLHEVAPVDACFDDVHFGL
jgi:hypothetical protein